MTKPMTIFDAAAGVIVAARCPARFNPTMDACVAAVMDGEVVGGFLFCDYTGPGGSYLTHVAGWKRGWLSRELLFNAANYAFNHSLCGKIFGQVPATKPKVLAFDLKMGWKEEARLEGVYPDGACHIISMVKEDCRWLDWKPSRGEDGKA